MFFTSNGKVYKLKGYQIPEAGRTAKGTAIVNLLQLDAGEKITTVIPVPDLDEDKNLIMSTLKGTIKKTPLKSFANIRKGGIIAITLVDDDELISVKMTEGSSNVFLATWLGMSITFNENDVRTMGRSAQGVMGIRLSDDDFVIGMEILNENETILSITENGFGKRTYADEYTVQKRGGKGILNYRVTEKTGHVVGTKVVSDDDDILLISTSGIIIRMCSNEISILGRATQGVTLMRTDEENTVVSLAKIAPEDVGDDVPDKDSEIDPFDEEPEDEEIEENDSEDEDDDLE